MTDRKPTNNAEDAEGIDAIAFSKPLNVEKIKVTGLRETISANEQECQVLAQQLKINKLDTLTFKCELMPWKKGGVKIKGVLSATIEETCVVTLESFTTEISEEVERFYERKARQARQDSVKSQSPLLDLEDVDDDVPDIIEGGSIDIGEIAVETLALSLSPYPRKPGVVFEDHLESDPEQSDDPARKNPFDVLKNLKKH